LKESVYALLAEQVPTWQRCIEELTAAYGTCEFVLPFLVFLLELLVLLLELLVLRLESLVLHIERAVFFSNRLSLLDGLIIDVPPFVSLAIGIFVAAVQFRTKISDLFIDQDVADILR
jgi:hypothetical protein